MTRGRPRLPARTRLSARVEFRLTDADYKFLFDWSDNDPHGTSPHDLAREIVMDWIARVSEVP